MSLHMRIQSALPRLWIHAEFQRLLWLYFRVTLLALLLLLTLVLYVADMLSVEDRWNYAVLLCALGLATVWGLVSRSLKKDFGGYMFDQLRMSSLSPWQMTYARLLAAPLLGWLMFVLGLLLMAWHPYVLNYGHHIMPAPYWFTCSLMSLWSLAALIMINGLQRRNERDHKLWSGDRAQSTLLCVSLLVVLLSLLRDPAIVQQFGDKPLTSGTWYKQASDEKIVLSFVGLAVLMGGAARASMANALHLVPTQGFWLIFALLLPSVLWWYFATWQFGLLVMTLIYGGLAWISLVCQDSRASTLWFKLRTKRFVDLPAWFYLLPLTVVCALFLSPSMALTYVLNFSGLLICYWYALLLPLPYHYGTVALIAYLLQWAAFEAKLP